MPDESGGARRVDDIIPADFFASYQAGIYKRSHIAVGDVGESSGLGQGDRIAYWFHTGSIPRTENTASPTDAAG